MPRIDITALFFVDMILACLHMLCILTYLRHLIELIKLIQLEINKKIKSYSMQMFINLKLISNLATLLNRQTLIFDSKSIVPNT